ncbi:MAG: CPBP family intramembrane glutamic endopeptidase [Chloroflexota bacterium]
MESNRNLVFVEVGIVYFLMIYVFRAVLEMPLAQQISAGLNGHLFPAYAALMAAAFVVYNIRAYAQLRLPTPDKRRHQLAIAGVGFLPAFLFSALLSWVDWQQWRGALLLVAALIVMLVWFGWAARKKPSWQQAGMAGGLLLLPLAAPLLPRIGDVLLAVVYFYFFVALSEETLFRGYIQVRLNSVLGRPFRFFGIPWGWGLVVSSLLFGLWHWGWLPGEVRWTQVVWTIFAGLFFGIVREKSEGVIAPAILHGVVNYGPQAALLYLLWR